MRIWRRDDEVVGSQIRVFGHTAWRAVGAIVGTIPKRVARAMAWLVVAGRAGCSL